MISDLSRLLQTFVGPLELGLCLGGIAGLAFPSDPASAKTRVGVIAGVVFCVLPVLLALGVYFERAAYCARAARGGAADPLYDYLILLSLTAAFGVGRVIRGERLFWILTGLAILFGCGWVVATFFMVGTCGPAR